MATTKVGIYRSYYGPIPTDSTGQPLPQPEWARKRPFSWVVRWFGADGNRYSKSFEARKEAERFAEEKQAEVREDRSDPPPSVTLRQYEQEHAQLMRDALSPRTLSIHRNAWALLAQSVGWDYPLHRVSARQVEQFRARRMATGISPASANKEMRAIRRMFNLAARRGYLPARANPCNGLSQLKVGRKRPPYCSAEEFQRVLASAADPLWRALLATVYTTGLRWRELLNLTWADVEFGAGQVHVTPKAACGWVQAWAPKDKDARIIPLPPQAVDLLTRWQAAAPVGCPYIFMDDGRWEFYRHQAECGQWRAGQDLVNNLLRRFRTLCRKAKVGSYTLHDLRRSCITNWARHLPIHVVQQLAGHSDIKTTQQYYLSVQPEDVRKAQRVQSRVLGRIPAASATDQLLTKSASVRHALGQRLSRGLSQAKQKQGLGKRTLQDSNLQPTAP